MSRIYVAEGPLFLPVPSAAVPEPESGLPAGSGLVAEAVVLSQDLAFTLHGTPATYTAPGGSPLAITVIAHRPDRQLNWTESQLHTETALFRVRVAELPNPVDGATLLYLGDTYVLDGAPRRDDPLRLVWILETRPQ